MGASQSMRPQAYRRRPDLPQQQAPSRTEDGCSRGKSPSRQAWEQRRKCYQSPQTTPPTSDLGSFPPMAFSAVQATVSSSSETSVPVGTTPNDSPFSANQSRLVAHDSLVRRVAPRQLSTAKVTNSGLTRSRRFNHNLNEMGVCGSNGKVFDSRASDSSSHAMGNNWVQASALSEKPKELTSESSGRASLTMKVASPSPLFLVRDKQDEEERNSIAQAEAAYERATWRMYQRIAHARAERDRRQQRFRVPPPAPRGYRSSQRDYYDSNMSRMGTTEEGEFLLRHEWHDEASIDDEQPTVFSLELA